MQLRRPPSTVDAPVGQSTRAQPRAPSANPDVVHIADSQVDANSISHTVGEFLYRHDDEGEAGCVPEVRPPVNKLDISYHQASLLSRDPKQLRAAQHNLEQSARDMLDHWRIRRGTLAGDSATVDATLASQLRQTALPRVLDEYGQMLSLFQQAEAKAKRRHGSTKLQETGTKEPAPATPKQIVESLKPRPSWHALLNESRVQLEAQRMLDRKWKPAFELKKPGRAR